MLTISLPPPPPQLTVAMRAHHRQGAQVSRSCQAHLQVLASHSARQARCARSTSDSGSSRCKGCQKDQNSRHFRPTSCCGFFACTTSRHMVTGGQSRCTTAAAACKHGPAWNATRSCTYAPGGWHRRQQAPPRGAFSQRVGHHRHAVPPCSECGLAPPCSGCARWCVAQGWC
jgi:hypothetical protein